VTPSFRSDRERHGGPGSSVCPVQMPPLLDEKRGETAALSPAAIE
jgi:hypothetical protein